MPSSLFFGLRHPWAPLRNSLRCWRRGGRVAKREGGWAPSPRRSCSGGGDFSPRREGPSAFARTTPPHPTGRSLGSPTLLIMSAGVHTHAPDPDQPRYALSLTTSLAPCLALRVFFASTSDSLASAPIDGLEAGEAGKPSTGSRSSSSRTPAQKKSAVLWCSGALALRGACDGLACVRVRCTVRRVGGATLVPSRYRDKPPWMYMSVRCRRVSVPNVFGDCAIIYM